jgi:methionyl aminopeptidase
MDKLEAMRYAGRVNRDAINYGFRMAVPGTTLLELDSYIEGYIRDHNCSPAFKGYRGFPGTACLSINEVAVHGLPNGQIIREGDLLTIDVGSIHEDWYVDAAETRMVGAPAKDAFDENHLLKVGRAALDAQIQTVRSGVSLLDLVRASENAVVNTGVNIIHLLTGHQIGSTVHEDPKIPAAIDPNLRSIQKQLCERQLDKIKLYEGQTICLEPVVTLGMPDIILDDDQWTCRTIDGALSAHFENCMIVTNTGCEILS